MTDTNTLLMMVLKKHYKECPEVLNEALKVIKEYSNKVSNLDDYKKTIKVLLKTLNDLPSNILHYFLTMVPSPKITNNVSISLKEAMGNYDIPSSAEIQMILSNHLEKLHTPSSTPVSIQAAPSPTASDSKSNRHNDCLNDTSEMSGNCAQKDICKDHCKEDPDYVVPIKKLKINKTKLKPKPITKEKSYECKKLLDICAEYVIRNQNKLKRLYKIKKEIVWNVVNRNFCVGDDLTKCYDLIKDLNKKTKWIRSIDDEETLTEIINEEYKDSAEIFLRQQHLMYNFKKDPFALSDQLEKSIDKLFRS